MHSETHIEEGNMNKIDKSIRNSTWLGIAFLVVVAACIGAFKIIGQEIDAQGILHEPFFLIPLFWLFLFLGAMTGLVNIITRLVRAGRRKAANG